jgi:hypothetical protein
MECFGPVCVGSIVAHTGHSGIRYVQEDLYECGSFPRIRSAPRGEECPQFSSEQANQVSLSERQRLLERTSQEDRVEDKFGGNVMHFRRGMKTIPKDECVRVDPQISL